MKIFKTAILWVFAITLTSTIAFAGTSQSSKAGEKISITDTDANFEFTPSPSTLLALNTSDTAFAMAAGSDKTTKDNGYEYGVLSTASPVYQKKKTDDTTHITPPTDANTLAGEWKDKAGNSPPSSGT